MRALNSTLNNDGEGASIGVPSAILWHKQVHQEHVMCMCEVTRRRVYESYLAEIQVG